MAESPTDTPRRPHAGWASPLPDVAHEQSLNQLVRSLAAYIDDAIDFPHTFEQMRTGLAGPLLSPLIEHLSIYCHQSHLVIALLVLKWHYADLEPDDRGLNTTRGLACEIVAWRVLSHLSETEALDYLLCEVPYLNKKHRNQAVAGASAAHDDGTEETSSLLHGSSALGLEFENRTSTLSSQPSVFNAPKTEDDPTVQFAGLSALEIAVIADAKKFLAQRSVQRIIHAIWCGDIVFWDSMNVSATKKAHKYNQWKSDPYSRLRVPKYQKVFEAIFIASFLGLYYAVLVERNPDRITFAETLLYLWIAAFAYDEFGELQDAGSWFYTRDMWNLWDISIVLVGLAFLITRIVGVSQGSELMLNVSFDILSLEALFLFPRLFSLLSLNQYFGTLIPSLREMTRDFLKFLVLVLILYFGFLTTFAMLGRDEYSPLHISWLLVYVFFGSSYMGFDIAQKISPVLGPPLMIIFVCMTNILLITSLISILSNSLSRVMDHAREEYLFQYSVFVLEAASSRRLTYYFPPLNLIPLVLFRPLRLCVPAEKLRGSRIILLKITHVPYVAAIWAYEGLWARLPGRDQRTSWQSQSHKPSMPISAKTPPRLNQHGFRRPLAPGLRNTSQNSLPRSPHHARGESGPNTSSHMVALNTEIHDLKAMLGKMSGQIEELSRKLSQASSSPEAGQDRSA